MALINIPKEIFVGTQTKGVPADKAFTGDMCPNEAKRKDRIQNIKHRNTTSATLANVLLPGFTLTKPGYSWAGTKDYWSVIDPRGFKIQITSDNVANIVDCSGITEGLIHERCVWGYDSGEIILLPANSDPYKEAKSNTDLLNKRVYMRDLQPGDRILAQNKAVGVFLGNWTYVDTIERPMPQNYVLYGNTHKVSVIRIEDASGKCGGYYLTSTLKVSEITEKAKTPLKDDDIKAELNAAIMAPSTPTATSMFTSEAKDTTHAGHTLLYSWLKPQWFAKKHGGQVTISLEEVKIAEFKTHLTREVNKLRYGSDYSTIVEYGGKQYFGIPSSGGNRSIGTASWNSAFTAKGSTTLAAPEILGKHDDKIHVRREKILSRSNYSRSADITLEKPLQEFEKYYIIHRTYDNDTF